MKLQRDKNNPRESTNLYKIDSKIKALDDSINTAQATAETAQAAVDAISVPSLSDCWPINSVYLSIVDTNPATLFGFGTWSRIAEGQFLVGQNDADGDFDDAEETGGAKTHIHKVNPPNTTTSDPSVSGDAHLTDGTQRHTRHPHTHDVDIAEFDSGSGSSIPPYFVVYIWKRTA